MTPSGGIGASRGGVDDDLTEEEKQQVEEVRERQQKLKAELHEKMLSEQSERNARKKAGYDAIQQWQTERKGQI